MPSALVHLQRSVELRPDLADAHYNLGVALWYSGSRDQAIPELREAVRLDPTAGAAQAFLGSALRESGDLPGARLSLQRAIALLPPIPATYIDLGIVYLQMGNLDRGLGQIEAGLNASTDAPPTPDWDSAIAGLRKALQTKPDRADAHNILGLLLGRKGADSKEVLAEFREAIRLRPDFAQAHNNIGLVLTQSGDDPGAIAAFREAIRLRPDYADAHANLGAAITPTDNEQAVRELEKAVALAPASVKAQFNLALAYSSSPAHGPAKEIEQLRKVLGAAPNFVPAHVALGKALLRDGKVPEAIEELQQTVKLDPQNGEAHYQLGLALARAGKKKKHSPNCKRDANWFRPMTATRMPIWISRKDDPRSTRAISIRRPKSFATRSIFALIRRMPSVTWEWCCRNKGTRTVLSRPTKRPWNSTPAMLRQSRAWRIFRAFLRPKTMRRR